MKKLDENLKFFINRKIQDDVEWQKCKVVYSSHQTPGEGEHVRKSCVKKIQENYASH
jgi:5'-3' exoribonuclease 1